MHQTLSQKAKNTSDQPYRSFEGIAIPHLKIKCMDSSTRIQNMLSYHQIPVSDIPLKLAESIFLGNSYPSGPWKVCLPSGNRTYSIRQKSDQKTSFGEICQNIVCSNESGIGYITMKPAKTQILDIDTEIGSIDLINDKNIDKCHAKIDLITMYDAVIAAGCVTLVKVHPKSTTSLRCQTEFHAVNIESKSLSIRVFRCNQVRYVFENTMDIRVKNTSRSAVKIKKGSDIACAECCHGHYQDSIHFK